MDMGKRAMDNIRCVLSVVTSEYKSTQQNQMSNTADDHRFCTISIGTITKLYEKQLTLCITKFHGLYPTMNYECNTFYQHIFHHITLLST